MADQSVGTCIHGNFPDTCAHCNAWRERFIGRPLPIPLSLDPTSAAADAVLVDRVMGLIAAAPDLLAALLTIVDGTEGIDREARDAAEAAITKAGGQ